jgi:hypothetical protein
MPIFFLAARLSPCGVHCTLSGILHLTGLRPDQVAAKQTQELKPFSIKSIKELAHRRGSILFCM